MAFTFTYGLFLHYKKHSHSFILNTLCDRKWHRLYFWSDCLTSLCVQSMNLKVKKITPPNYINMGRFSVGFCKWSNSTISRIDFCWLHIHFIFPGLRESLLNILWSKKKYLTKWPQVIDVFEWWFHCTKIPLRAITGTALEKRQVRMWSQHTSPGALLCYLLLFKKVFLLLLFL